MVFRFKNSLEPGMVETEKAYYTRMSVQCVCRLNNEESALPTNE